MTPDDFPPGRRLWAVLDLLDYQIVDRAELLAGKVDDLELEVGDGDDALPVVTALVSGLGAVAAQIGGAAGRWLGAVERRLVRDDTGASELIPFALVDVLGDHVHVAADREALVSNRAEAWARDVFISKIPGSDHEAH